MVTISLELALEIMDVLDIAVKDFEASGRPMTASFYQRRIDALGVYIQDAQAERERTERNLTHEIAKLRRAR